MTLTEIQTIVEELAVRHDPLTVNLLETLLDASGWEDKAIKDAVVLFKQKEKDGSLFQLVQEKKAREQQTASSGPIVYYQKDGAEEKNLPKITEPENKVVREDIPKQKPGLEQKSTDTVETKKEGFLQTSFSLPEVTFVNDIPKEVKEDTPKKDPSLAIKLPSFDLVKDISFTQPEEIKKKEEKSITSSLDQKPKEETVAQKEIQKESLQENSTIQQKQEAKPVLVEKKEVKQEPVKILPPVERLPNEGKNTEEFAVHRTDVFAQSSVLKVSPEKHDSKESLVTSEPSSKKPKEVEPPLDLPLLPFESSPHVWSFGKYKKVFHGEEKNNSSQEKEKQVSPVQPSPKNTIAQALPVTPHEEEIVAEAVPMTKGDESLVMLAGVMLVAILLILGYMYSNGRL
jgi:hypothetical protein